MFSRALEDTHPFVLLVGQAEQLGPFTEQSWMFYPSSLSFTRGTNMTYVFNFVSGIIVWVLETQYWTKKLRVLFS